MNSKQRKTLVDIFTTPTLNNIEWMDVEKLLLAVGAKRTEGSGSRVRFKKNGEGVLFHRPHPEKEANRYQIRDVRNFLKRVGIEP